MSNLKLISLKEDPSKLEEVMINEHKKYNADSEVKALLDSIYLEPDRDLAFQRFYNSNEFSTIYKILEIFKINKDKKLCEIGGGAGFLTWALNKIGYNIDLVEPSQHYNTGVKYLRERNDTKNIKIYTDFEKWHASNERYDIIITKNCIHHFQNISMAAATIRQKMTDGGRWFSFRESFADTSEELYRMLATHPYSQTYNLYEWFYPSSHYAEAIEISGFTLEAIIPFDYANNCLGTYSEDTPSTKIVKLTNSIDKLLIKAPHKTVKKFWKEIKINKFKNGNLRFYTRPQMMLFSKI